MVIDNRGHNLALKRLFDVVCSALGIFVLSPILLLIAVAVALDSRGGALFRQQRIGLHGQPFLILKFRTMVPLAERQGMQITVGADKRITRVGAFLRKTKLDELPQLFNVLVGDMSFVGPRPEVPKYVALYTDAQRVVLQVRPGITDIASIEYRKESELLAKSADPERTYIEEIMPEKLRLNMVYLQRITIANDLKIILKTLAKIFT